MEYEILYQYDYWNCREDIELYNQKFHTEWSFEGLKVGTRLCIQNELHSKATAVLTEIQDLGNNIYICKTNRSCTIIRRLADI